MRESVIGREMNVCKGEGKKKNEIEGGSIWNYFFLHFLLHVDNYVILFERKERWIIFINSFFTNSIFRNGGSFFFFYFYFLFLFVSRVLNHFFPHFSIFYSSQATDQDREWDAWKEENAKGSGNKMGKRY